MLYIEKSQLQGVYVYKPHCHNNSQMSSNASR